MKILILDTYYPAFTSSFYARHPEYARQPYHEQWRAVMDQCFGACDAYSAHLALLGHQAHEVVVNNGLLQRQWAAEHAPSLARAYPFFTALERLRRRWQLAVFHAQLEWFRPDVLYVQDINWLPAAFLRSLHSRPRLIAGQTAYPIPPGIDLRAYDLVLTSFPHFVTRFRAQGIDAEYLRIAFDERIASRLPSLSPAYQAVFVGGYSPAHRRGIHLLETMAGKLPIDFWGYGVEQLRPDSPIRRRFHGEAWGLEMYTVLASARVALNRHINVAENFANNMRLYEATGVGTCLVTDMKDNLGELFVIDYEVVAYENADDCIEKVRYLLDHENERAAIARAGQQRTLREHTYARRMEELSAILDRYLRRPRRAEARTFSLSTAARSIAAWHRTDVSHGHQIIAPTNISSDLIRGWQDGSIPAEQRRLVQHELRAMYRGQVTPVFAVAADAVRATGLVDPYIVEIGCASAYYSEALAHLLGRPLRYVGIDYSIPLLREARHHYPAVPLAGANATSLPLQDRCCDIAFSSALLMHVPGYRQAIYETARLARHWCIFHRTPLVHLAPTTYLTKYAYDVPVIELVFNEDEFLGLLGDAGLAMRREFMMDRATIPGIAEPIELKTYVCEVTT